MKSQLSSIVLQGDINIPLKIGKNIIRRHKINGAKYMSKNHCVMYVKEKKERIIIMISDSSLNGTYLNGSHLRQTTAIVNIGDTIGFGNNIHRFVVHQAPTITII